MSNPDYKWTTPTILRTARLLWRMMKDSKAALSIKSIAERAEITEALAKRTLNQMELAKYVAKDQGRYYAVGRKQPRWRGRYEDCKARGYRYHKDYTHERERFERSRSSGTGTPPPRSSEPSPGGGTDGDSSLGAGSVDDAP